jgi:threonyl-tRNA synthetase
MSNIEQKRHSLAHLLAAAVTELYPTATITLGPPIENGFYYDIDFGDEKISDSDLKNIQKKMKKISNGWKEFTREELDSDKAHELFKDNPYKLELIKEITEKEEEINIYKSGNFFDLCRGNHVDTLEDIEDGSWCLDKVAGAYWRGDEKNKMLTRIYGLAFDTKKELDDYLEKRVEAEKRDHRKIGRELDLYTTSELVGSGLPLFTPKGTLIRDLIMEKINKIQSKYEMQKVTTPHITRPELYETSGHLQKFKDQLFHVTSAHGGEFLMKPMNCPHHTQIFAGQNHSYRDLPIRYTELGVVYRDEQQGELMGLSRVRSISQDDGHTFCRKDQIEGEVAIFVEIIKEFYTSLGMFEKGKYWVSLSVRNKDKPETYMGEDSVWDKAELALEDIAKAQDLEYKKIKGEAAFYGPKLDFMFYDALGRERQLATIQLDFQMPGRFDLTFTNKEGEKETPVMIHRAIAGSLERFMAMMIEHFAGHFPLWLSPIQIAVVPINQDAHGEKTGKIVTELKDLGLRVEHYDSSDSLGKRIRKAKLQKIPYIIVMGDTEIKKKTFTVEMKDNEKIEGIKQKKFIKKILEELDK